MVDNRFYQLLAHTHRGGSYGYYSAKTTGEDGKSNFTSHWWHAQQPSPVPAYKADWYFGVHPSLVMKGKKERAKKDEIPVINCLYADIDGKDFPGGIAEAQEFIRTRLAPSVTTLTGGGMHLLFFLEQPYRITGMKERLFAEKLQKSLVNYLRADKNAKDLARILRIPGTVNRKKAYDRPRPVELVEFNPDCLYSIGSLVDIVGNHEPIIINNSETLKTGVLREVSRKKSDGIPIRLIRHDVPKKSKMLLEKLRSATPGEQITLEIPGEDPKTYQSRSEAEAAVVMSLILNGFMFDEIEKVFGKWKPGHYMDKGVWDSTYLPTIYQNAIYAVLTDATRSRLLDLYREAENRPWYGRTGSVDKAVLLAIIAKCFQFKSISIGVSTREIEIHSGVPYNTAANGIRRLSSQGFIKIVEKAHGKSPNVIDVTPFQDSFSYLNNSIPSLPSPKYYCSSMQKEDHPAWYAIELTRKNGRKDGPILTRAAFEIAQALSEEVLSVQDLYVRTGRNKSTIYRWLKDLVQKGLARKVGNGWVKGDRGINQLADEYGSYLRARQRLELHQQQRREFRSKRYEFTSRVAHSR